MLFLKRLNDQFQQDREALRNEYQTKHLKPDLIEKQLANPDKYDFFVPDDARWNYQDDEGHNQGIAHLKTAVGSGLNKALAAVEDANPDTLQDVLKGITSTARSVSGRSTTPRWSSSSSTSPTSRSATTTSSSRTCSVRPTSTSSSTSPTAPGRRAASSTRLPRSSG